MTPVAFVLMVCGQIAFAFAFTDAIRAKRPDRFFKALLAVYFALFVIWIGFA